MNKKILAFSLLTTFVIMTAGAPVSALIEFNKDKKQQQSQTTILDDINFDWWKNNRSYFHYSSTSATGSSTVLSTLSLSSSTLSL